MEKLPALEKNFRIHLIGRLQSNKVKYIIDHVCLIHSVDRLSLAQEIDRQAQKHNRVMPVLIQVSPCGEAQKGGLPPEELTPFLRTVSQLPGLSVQGLMAVMPNTPDTALLDKLFADMRTLFERARAEAIPGIGGAARRNDGTHRQCADGRARLRPARATLMAAVLIRRNMPEAGGAEKQHGDFR